MLLQAGPEFKRQRFPMRFGAARGFALVSPHASWHLAGMKSVIHVAFAVAAAICALLIAGCGPV